MKKRPIVILLIAAIFTCSCVLNAFDLNLTIKTIVVTLIVALFCAIRVVVSLHFDDEVVDNGESSGDTSP